MRDLPPHDDKTVALWQHTEKIVVPPLVGVSDDVLSRIVSHVVVAVGRYQQSLTREWHADIVKRIAALGRFSTISLADRCAVLQELLCVVAITCE